MIQEVALKNWKSHGEKNGSYGSILSFERGLNVIYGVNGSGKSSVAEAIAYAFFGEAPSFKRIVRAGKESGSVKLIFSVDGVYEVRRDFNRKGTVYAELFRIENGRKRPVVLQKSSEVTKKIEEILGVSKDLFFRALYGAQNRILELFEKKGVSRAEIFDEILGLEELMDVRERLVKLRNALLRETKTVSLGDLMRRKKELVEERSRLTGEIVDVEKRIAFLEEEVRLITKELEEASSKLSELENKIELLEKLRRKEVASKRTIEELKLRIKFEDASESDLKALELFKEKISSINSLRERLTVLQARLESVVKELSQISVEEEPLRLDELRRELNEKKKAVERVEKEIFNLNREREQLLQQRAFMRSRLEQLKREEAELKELEERRRRIIEILEHRASYIEEELQKIIDLLSRKRGELVLSENVVSLLEGTRRCPVCGTELSPQRIRELIEEHTRRRLELKDELAEIETRKAELERLAEEIRRYRVELSQIEERIENLTLDVAEIPKIEETLAEVERQLSELESNIQELERKRSELQKEIEAIQLEIESEVKRKEALERKKRLDQEKANLERELNEVKGKLERLLDGLGLSSVEEVEKRHEVLRDRAESYRLKQRLLEIEKELEEIRRGISELSPVEREAEELRTKVMNLRERKASLDSSLENLHRLLEEKGKRLDLVESTLGSIEETLERMEKIRVASRKVDLLIAAWNETLKEVREMRIEAINRALKLVWKRVYLSQYGDYTDVDFSLEESRSGYTYSLKLKTRVGAKEIWRSVEELSGGERTLALIALRIAISYLLSGRARFLIMDEPTHNLDENLTRQLAFFLKEATSENGLFDQIIVITHDPVFSEAADVVYRLEREKTGDDPTRVIRER